MKIIIESHRCKINQLQYKTFSTTTTCECFIEIYELLIRMCTLILKLEGTNLADYGGFVNTYIETWLKN